jgi:N-acetyl sugar amidotransferase
LNYCTRCVMPDTKPDLALDANGVCSACRAYEQRSEIDWDSRERDFLSLVSQLGDKSSSGYDCIVPVSGGKDSTFQVIKMKELGLNPLAVTATTCDFSEIGRRNLDNLRQIGVDHITVSPNPKVRKKLNRIGLELVGDISWPEHVGIFTIPVRMAVSMNIPLIVWGENSQNEYGGPEKAAQNAELDRNWLEEFGGLLGLRVSDISNISPISPDDLVLYTYPSEEAIGRLGLKGLFLGQFFPWDGLNNAQIAKAHGFETLSHVVEGSMVDYENLDNHQTGIHDYFKFLKFGFSRTSDIASLYIRRGRMTRDEGLEISRELDGKFPWTCLGKPLEEILEPLELGVDAFIEICDRFTNSDLFQTDQKGELVRDTKGNLTKLAYDNPRD